jgi:hypothetical protein
LGAQTPLSALFELKGLFAELTNASDRLAVTPATNKIQIHAINQNFSAEAFVRSNAEKRLDLSIPSSAPNRMISFLCRPSFRRALDPAPWVTSKQLDRACGPSSISIDEATDARVAPVP